MGKTDLMNEVTEARNETVYDPSLDTNSLWVETDGRRSPGTRRCVHRLRAHPACGKVTDLTYLFLRARPRKSHGAYHVLDT